MRDRGAMTEVLPLGEQVSVNRQWLIELAMFAQNVGKFALAGIDNTFIPHLPRNFTAFFKSCSCGFDVSQHCGSVRHSNCHERGCPTKALLSCKFRCFL